MGGPLSGLPEPPGAPRVPGRHRGNVARVTEREALVVLRGSDAVKAAHAASLLWEMWHRSGDPQVDAVLRQGIEAMERQDVDQAEAIFTRVIQLAPAFAEG